MFTESVAAMRIEIKAYREQVAQAISTGTADDLQEMIVQRFARLSHIINLATSIHQLLELENENIALLSDILSESETEDVPAMA